MFLNIVEVINHAKKSPEFMAQNSSWIHKCANVIGCVFFSRRKGCRTLGQMTKDKENGPMKGAQCEEK